MSETSSNKPSGKSTRKRIGPCLRKNRSTGQKHVRRWTKVDNPKVASMAKWALWHCLKNEQLALFVILQRFGQDKKGWKETKREKSKSVVLGKGGSINVRGSSWHIRHQHKLRYGYKYLSQKKKKKKEIKAHIARKRELLRNREHASKRRRSLQWSPAPSSSLPNNDNVMSCK